MRFILRTLVFLVLMLAAFWFTAENANEIVQINLVFVRIRASLPLVVFGSILGGMGLSAWVGWRADKRAQRRRETREASLLGLDDAPAVSSGGMTSTDFASPAPEPEPIERSPYS